ncbi:unnamed protein product [Protopolystoma xenopodis]|uniref:Uncharacterized protein n=1 Tax=Protopolystoma xenopodis TaxID=117903 RepID=A0A448WDL3_9PLAT|nr:unnamed protein product [Protopolystoma xenopodis]
MLGCRLRMRILSPECLTAYRVDEVKILQIHSRAEMTGSRGNASLNTLLISRSRPKPHSVAMTEQSKKVSLFFRAFRTCQQASSSVVNRLVAKLPKIPSPPPRTGPVLFVKSRAKLRLPPNTRSEFGQPSCPRRGSREGRLVRQ